MLYRSFDTLQPNRSQLSLLNLNSILLWTSKMQRSIHSAQGKGREKLDHQTCGGSHCWTSVSLRGSAPDWPTLGTKKCLVTVLGIVHSSVCPKWWYEPDLVPQPSKAVLSSFELSDSVVLSGHYLSPKQACPKFCCTKTYLWKNTCTVFQIHGTEMIMLQG